MTDGGMVALESGIGQEVRRELARRGHRIRLLVGPFALRLRGLYLAIVTLGLLFLVDHVLLSVPSLTGGVAELSRVALAVDPPYAAGVVYVVLPRRAREHAAEALRLKLAEPRHALTVPL